MFTKIMLLAIFPAGQLFQIRATAPKLRSNIIFISKDFSQNNHHTIIFRLYALFFNRLKHDSSCFKLSYYYHATIILSAYTFTHIADNMIFIFY